MFLIMHNFYKYKISCLESNVYIRSQNSTMTSHLACSHDNTTGWHHSWNISFPSWVGSRWCRVERTQWQDRFHSRWTLPWSLQTYKLDKSAVRLQQLFVVVVVVVETCCTMPLSLSSLSILLAQTSLGHRLFFQIKSFKTEFC